MCTYLKKKGNKIDTCIIIVGKNNNLYNYLKYRHTHTIIQKLNIWKICYHSVISQSWKEHFNDVSQFMVFNELSANFKIIGLTVT